MMKVMIKSSTLSLCEVIIAEVLAKDKKSKDEKTLTLGQCCIDLLPLLKGRSIEGLYQILSAFFQNKIALHLYYISKFIWLNIPT